ncbi:MAG: molecular chaperone DnaJ [Candidatus Ryanbacteria bacterium CG10_big_fil_rev_8_21_14_0_10_43_42]|uniref:Chaperone protein DnaJ n=1 Tax=Candidatus Ryanbacteria bacterium CG10_big_fil_rev_8_21_14_0_10_43_42 TaxID=1974864 RepID=A0A2M8KX28_9BACT|nr:MAG: molecular chaperone DnaJ [Candidatus Ryanbacteria bacterium CG10_big_fil_rev_8_21_14_0_10_43_42]
MKDYYDVLGIARNASAEDIKKAYRKLAHQHHPDKSGGDDVRFKEINEAYQVLGDEQKRAQYDRFGNAGFNPSGGGGWDGGNAYANGFEGVDLGDIFGDIFGFNTGKTRTPRGRDISIDIELSFKEAVFGTERSVLLQKISACSVCSGGGNEPGTPLKTCSSCNGSGQVHETRRSVFGTFTTKRACTACHGSGQVPEKICKECRGEGIKQGSEEVTISIPSGIDNGEMIKLVGKGEAVQKGIAGDLYVKIHIAPHKKFSRTGNDITLSLDVPFTDVALGTTETIETLDGTVQVQIPAGTDSGTVLRIRGKGVPRARSSRGDLLIKVIAKTPKKLSRKAKNLLEELKEEGL